MPGKRGTTRTYQCPPDHKHDATGTCFNQHGCGCYPCVEGRRIYQEARYKAVAYGRWDGAKSVDGRGTRRRLQALAFMGWPSQLIAAEVGTSPSHVRKLARCESLSPSSAKRVAAAYARIWAAEPSGGRRKYVANMARREGWVGPMAWDDIDNDPEPVEVERDTDRAAWIVEELEHLYLSGESQSSVSVAVGRTGGAMAKLARRHGRQDLARWIEAA